MSSFGNNHCLGLIAGNKRIRFTAADVFLRCYGFYIEIEALDGHAFIVGSIDRGSMDRHEFRFAQILDWIREPVRPLVWRGSLSSALDRPAARELFQRRCRG